MFRILTVLALPVAMFAANNIYEFNMNSIDGRPVSLSEYKGKAVLLVNVASRCGYTPQYAGLEKLYQKYKDQGLVIVGVPANNFGGQEPGSNAEIKTFCSRTYGVTFPMMAKVSVKGADQDPLYQYLTSSGTSPSSWCGATGRCSSAMHRRPRPSRWRPTSRLCWRNRPDPQRAGRVPCRLDSRSIPAPAMALASDRVRARPARANSSDQRS